MQRAKVFPQHSLCPLPAACCASLPRATPHLERYFSELTRRSIPTYLPTCSSPASMVSSTLVAVASPTPTLATIFPTCGMVVPPRNLELGGCPLVSCRA